MTINQPGHTAPPEYYEYLKLENEVFVGKKKSALLWKMDWRVTLPLALTYLVGYVDRSNSE